MSLLVAAGQLVGTSSPLLTSCTLAWSALLQTRALRLLLLEGKSMYRMLLHEYIYIYVNSHILLMPTCDTAV